jgi:predicted NBD/HSP70 family sugar kinase
VISLRQQNLLELLLRHRQLSRAQLHSLSGIRKMTVSADARLLLRHQLVRECGSRRISRGRPRTPVEIYPVCRHVVGLLIRPGVVEVSRCNLLGEELGKPLRRRVEGPSRLISVACELLRSTCDKRTLGVGAAVPGFVDANTRSVLMSSAWPGSGAVSLDPLYTAAGRIPLIIENDVHAMAARWLLEQGNSDTSGDDVLVVFHEDGQLGATMLIDGHPNRGCVVGANELGHTRLSIETPRCYCGGIGCLERIFSTEYLKRLDPNALSLEKSAARFDGKDHAMNRIVELLGCGIANAVNFTRVGRVVLVSELCENHVVADALMVALRRQMLPVLAKRVKIGFWGHHPRSGRTAAALALAGLYLAGWLPTETGRVNGNGQPRFAGNGANHVSS